MEYNKIRDKVFNKYPTTDLDGNRISLSYKFTRENSLIIRRGITELSRIEYELSDLSNINFIDDTAISFTFLIKDSSDSGKIWTSKKTFLDLERAKKENNPYYRLQDMLIIEMDLSKFINYSKESFLVDGESRAKVKVTETIDTLSEILHHITYLVDSTENEIKPTDRDATTNRGYPGLAKFEIIDDE